METIDIVIRINKDEYNYMKHFYAIKAFSGNYIAKQIVNGTVLPKGHGRLIDADKLPYEDIECTDGRTYMVVNAYDIDDAQPIIEADEDGDADG